MTRYAYGRIKSLLFKLEHELRQSLHHSMGMLELAAEEPLSPAQAGYLSECRAGADRLLQIANDVTEPAAPERPHAPGSTLHLATIIEEVAGIRLTEELKATQFYTRSLIESNIDALMTTDQLGVITDVNQQMEALTGSTREQLIGTPFKNCFTDPARARRTAVCRNWPCDSAIRTAVSTVIPGTRSRRNVGANCAAPDKGPLPEKTRQKLRRHVWQKNFYGG